MAWRDEAMFDFELLAQPVEAMVPAGLLLPALAGESIGKLAAVIGEQFADLDGTGGFYFDQEIDTAAVGLIASNGMDAPTRNDIDCAKVVSSYRKFIVNSVP